MSDSFSSFSICIYICFFRNKYLIYILAFAMHLSNFIVDLTMLAQVKIIRIAELVFCSSSFSSHDGGKIALFVLLGLEGRWWHAEWPCEGIGMQNRP